MVHVMSVFCCSFGFEAWLKNEFLGCLNLRLCWPLACWPLWPLLDHRSRSGGGGGGHCAGVGPPSRENKRGILMGVTSPFWKRGGDISPSLKVTAKAPENWWLENHPFLLGKRILWGELLVLGSAHKNDMNIICMYLIVGNPCCYLKCRYYKWSVTWRFC